MGVKVTNNSFGTISAGINSSATTVTVDSGQGARFPTLGSGDYFYATLVDTSNNLEIIKVTARSSDSMTVVRGQDNTSARAFSIGDRIELRPTAALFNEVISPSTLTVGSGSSATATTNTIVTVDGNDNTELSILGGSSSVLGINFGHSGDNDSARIDYNTTSGSEEMNFKVNGSNRMVIKPDGEINKPFQPCFSATAGMNNIPLSTQTTVTLGTERFDVGSNLASNTFTAPVTGKYLFTYMLYLTQVDSDHTTLDVHFKTSNKQYQQTWSPDHFLNSDSNFSVASAIIADMDANDTMYIAIYCVGGSAQTDVHADSQVSGCLLV